MFPKFVNVYLTDVDKKTYRIKKKLRKNAIQKQVRERNDFDEMIKNLELELKQNINSIDWHILVKLLRSNIKRKKDAAVYTQAISKKLFF